MTFEQLADLAEERIASEARKETARIEATPHLATCLECTSEVQRLEKVMLLMKSDREHDAPRDLLAYAVNIFDRTSSTKEPSILRRLVAVLTFDSNMNIRPAFGVRSGQAGSRQLLYSAEDHDVDVRITLQQDQWTIAGQILGADCTGGEVTLVNLPEIDGEKRSAKAVLNELCEFSLPPVAPGSYKLLLRFATSEVEVPRFELGS
jgi:hypothetical protein